MFLRSVIRNFSYFKYFDSSATTNVDPRIVNAIIPFLLYDFGNASSRTHKFGWNAENATENARNYIANLINADPREIIFTSGATESNNLILRGIFDFYKETGKNHIITSQIEHKSVLEVVRYLEQRGGIVTYLKPNSFGQISIDELKENISPKTLMVSINFVNSEIGTIQDIKSIGKLCRESKIFFHTDATQAATKIPIDVKDMYIDCMSFSGHKINAPKGIGGLYYNRRPRVKILPLILGGGQERGIRSGTLNVPGIVGLGKAFELAGIEMEDDYNYIKYLSDKLRNGIESNIKFVKFNGDPNSFYPGILNYTFKFIEGESLMMKIKEFSVSSGSACTSESLEPSYVLRSISVNDEDAHSSLRISLNKFNTEEEIDEFLQILIKAVDFLRDMSPLYELEIRKQLPRV